MSEWQPIETAPKDGTPIVGLCNHKADPYYVTSKYPPAFGEGPDIEVGCLTDYGARVEGLSHVEDGPHVIAWEDSREESEGWEFPSYTIPGGWYLTADIEVMANPTHWMPLPKAPA